MFLFLPQILDVLIARTIEYKIFGLSHFLIFPGFTRAMSASSILFLSGIFREETAFFLNFWNKLIDLFVFWIIQSIQTSTFIEHNGVKPKRKQFLVFKTRNFYSDVFGIFRFIHVFGNIKWEFSPRGSKFPHIDLLIPEARADKLFKARGKAVTRS